MTLPPDIVAAVDAWRAEQTPAPSRDEAVAQLLTDFLILLGRLPAPVEDDSTPD